jgi:hypothetical protein
MRAIGNQEIHVTYVDQRKPGGLLMMVRVVGIVERLMPMNEVIPGPPTIADIEHAIDALGYGTPEYHEALAFYCMTLARAQWRRAEMARRIEKARSTRTTHKQKGTDAE